MQNKQTLTGTEKEQIKVRGCLSKHKKRQYYQAILIYTDRSGKEHRTSRSTRETTERKAEKALRIMVEEMMEQLHDPDPSTLFTDFLEYWFKEIVTKQVEVTTLNGYRMNLENHIIPYFKPMKLRLSELRAAHFVRFVEEMQQKERRGGKPLSANSVKKLLANIRMALDEAMTRELIATNPARAVKSPKTIPYKAKYLSIDQITRLWEASKGTLIEPAVFLTSIYGFRRGEVCGLEWSCVDIPHRIMHIEQTRTRAQEMVMKGTKNSASNRAMPIMEAVADYLIMLKKRQEQAKKINGDLWENSGYVIIDEIGRPISLNRLNKHFGKLLESCGLPNVRFHDLRHSVATYLLELGIPIAEVSAWLGHSSIVTTSKIYAHVNIELRRNAARTLDKLMGYERNEAPKNIEGALRELFEPMLTT